MLKVNLFKKIKKIIIFCSVCLFLLTACSQPKDVTNSANQIVTAVENKDMHTLNQLILGYQSVSPDEEVTELFNTPNTEKGLIYHIIQEVTIKIKKIKKDNIIYEITAPDLKTIFQEVENEENLTEDTFEIYLYDYIKKANKVTTKVSINYTYEQGDFQADYTNREFVNALLGNMLESYQTLIEDVFSEYQEVNK